MKNYYSEQIIDSLRTEFIQEATNAPKLFKDLAKVEQAIRYSCWYEKGRVPFISGREKKGVIAMNILKVLMVVMFVTLAGCAPLVLNIKDPSPREMVKLNVGKIEFINNAKIETGGPSVLSDSTFPCPTDMQLQFHEAIKRNTVNSLLTTGNITNERAIIKINRAVVMRTVKGVKGIPFLGMLFLGIKEDYSAVIEGIIEIEDEQRRVIDKANFSSTATIKGDAATVEQIKEGTSNVVNEVLISLQKEIVEQSKRYLYKHLS